MGEAQGKCSWCGFEQLEEGWMSDFGQGARGYGTWIAGPLQKGLLGGARWFGKTRHDIVAARCTRCSHLELFVRPPD